MTISVERKPATGGRFDWYPTEIRPAIFSVPDGGALYVRLDLGASGGTSNLHVKVASDSFQELAIDMMRADREAAIKAFGAALQWEPFDVRMRRAAEKAPA